MARSIVGEIFLNVLPQDAGVGPGVQRIINAAQTNAAKIPVTAETRQAEEAVARLSGSISDGLGGAWLKAAAQAATFTAAVVGIERAVQGTLGKFAGLFDQLAQAQAGFTAILGSESSGARLLDEIREFARVSPFVTQQLVNYSQQLLGVGQSAESIVPLLKSTGDLIASVGGDTQNISRVLFTLTQIRSIGRLVGQDAIQLQSALVPITKLLADFLGKTTQEVKKLQEQGAISADTVFAAITNAGGKVEGAMATATRNIAGARSVLSDTFTILLQDSESLRRIFDDIVQGILSFSNALGEESVQQRFTDVTEGIGEFYDALQPVFEGFSGAAAQGALSALDILASTLEALAIAVNAIPEAGLRAIGIALATLAALKAPLYLIQYISSLRTLGSVISPAGLGRTVSGLTTTLKTQEQQLIATGVAADAAAAKFTGLRARMAGAQGQGAALGAGIAGVGLIGGSLLGGSEDTATSAFGGALTGASLGAATTGFNPFGIAAGAGIGLVTSLITSSRAAAREREGELEQIGAEMANKLVGGFFAVTPSGFSTNRGLDRFFGEQGVLGTLEADIQGAEDEITRLVGLRDDAIAETNKILDPTSTSTEFFGAEGSERAVAEITKISKAIRKLEDSIEAEETALGASKQSLDALFTENPEVTKFLEDAASRLSELNKTQPLDPDLFKPIKDLDSGEFFSVVDAARQLALVTGQELPKSGRDFELLEAGLAKVGLTMADTNRTVDELALLTTTDLPNALKRTRIELDAVRLALDESKKAATEFFAPFKVELEILKQTDEQTTKLAASFDALTVGSRESAEQQAFAAELLASAQSVFQATQLATNDAVVAASASTQFLASSFAELQSTLGLSEEKFKEFLIQAGLWGSYQSTIGTESGFVGNIAELAEVSKLSESRLESLLGLAGELDNREINILLTTGVQDAVTQIGILESNLTNLSADGVDRAIARINELEERLRILNGGVRTLDSDRKSIGLTPEERDALRARAAPGSDLNTANINNTFRSQQGEARRIAEELAAEEAERARKEAERLAEEARREAEQRAREAEALANSIRSAGESISGAVQQAADAIQQAADTWTSSIRERTQFERGLSASRLISNTGRQVSDLTELDAGIQALIQRGLSEEAITASGIDNVSDLRQVRKLLQASPADLAQLSALVGQRDDAAERIAERQAQEQTKNTIVVAIVEAARILGFELSPAQATQIAAQFTVNSETDAAQFGQSILDLLLSSGQIART